MSISGPGNHPLQFAYWVPSVSGGLAISNIPQRTSWDVDYNYKLAQIVECAGFDYALAQIRFTAGYGADDQHESVSSSQVLLASTDNLKAIAAPLLGSWSPTLATKQIATISHLYGPRIAASIVSDWFHGEFKAIGEPWPGHEECYPCSEEFIHCLQDIWRENSFTFAGDFYRSRDYSLKPEPLAPPPEISQGGSSHVAWNMAVCVPNWYFINGNTPEGTKAQMDDIRRRTVQNQHQMKIGVNDFVTTRESEKGAQVVLRKTTNNAGPDATEGPQHEVKNAGSASSEGEGNWTESGSKGLVQCNDGLRTDPIGTLQQIAKRIIALRQSGVNLLLLIFLRFQEEVEFFGREVIPRMCELEKQSQPATTHVVSEVLKY